MLALLPQRGLHRRGAVTRVSLACRAGWRAAGTLGGRRFDPLTCVSVALLLALAPLSQGGNAARCCCCCCACLTEPRFQRQSRYLFMTLSFSPSLSSSFHLLSVTTPPLTRLQPPSHARTVGFAPLHLEAVTGMLQRDELGHRHTVVCCASRDWLRKQSFSIHSVTSPSTCVSVSLDGRYVCALIILHQQHL